MRRAVSALKLSDPVATALGTDSMTSAGFLPQIRPLPGTDLIRQLICFDPNRSIGILIRRKNEGPEELFGTPLSKLEKRLTAVSGQKEAEAGE